MDQAERDRWIRAAELLDRILELSPDQQDEAATRLGASDGVRDELDALLAGARGASLLDASLEDVLQRMPPSVPGHNALKGRLLGRWMLGDEIGRGGMSVVYHAERTDEHFQQHAAVKVLSVGYLGKDFVTGFLRERQILSDLQHPGIASLIDGGITPDGAPFLVMQYVNGERIDHWCAKHEPDVQAIVDLIVKLCLAVSYAQRHLVVHQDINPANVLVDEHGQPVLIDFGIAKLLDRASGERTLRVFTPRFAAPEQRSGSAITTATDVYALGKLVCSLLSGRRIDRDLELILQVATHSNPEQRYANARMLAQDLQAWQEQRPVQARPSTFGYRVGRFIARNRWGVAAASVVMVSLMGGLGTALWQARVAAAERDVARLESARAMQVTAFLKDLFRASDPDRAHGQVVSARELLDQGAHQVRNAFGRDPRLQAEMLVLLGDLYRELGELDSAASLLQEGVKLAGSIDDVPLRVAAYGALARQRMERGAHEEALALAQRGEWLLEVAGDVPGRLHASLMEPMLFSLAELGRTPEALQRGEQALALARDRMELPVEALYDYLFNVANVMLIAELAGPAEELLLEAAALEFDAPADPSVQIALHSNLGGVFTRKGDVETALEHYRVALALAEEIYPPGHTERARKLSNLGSGLSNLGRHEEAEAALRESLAIYEDAYQDRKHPRVAAARNNLGRALQEGGNYAAAEPHLALARTLAAELFSPSDARYAIATVNLGKLHLQLGNLERAEELLLENLELRKSIFGPGHRAVGDGQSILAALRLEQGRTAEALQLAEEALHLFRRIGHENPRSLVAAMSRRARALADLGRGAEAEAAFAEALRLCEAAGVDAGTSRSELFAAHAEFLVQRGDPAAQSAVKKALEVHRQTLGDKHPATVRLRTLSAPHDAIGFVGDPIDG